VEVDWQRAAFFHCISWAISVCQ